mmetsp:Transcript_29675/g.74657  ORF Transcript_29675/g.74657 Transcript_29675/m.74657 type:complete len:232 (-) Transcript_29675:496-1191(-)
MALGAVAAAQAGQQFQIAVLLGRDVSVPDEEVNDDQLAVRLELHALRHHLHDLAHRPQHKLLHLAVLWLRHKRLWQLNVVHKHDVPLEVAFVHARVAHGAGRHCGSCQCWRDACLLAALFHHVLLWADAVRLPACHDVIQHARPRLFGLAAAPHPELLGTVRAPHKAVNVDAVRLDAQLRRGRALHQQQRLRGEGLDHWEQLVPPAGDNAFVPQVCRHLCHGCIACLYGAQ